MAAEGEMKEAQPPSEENPLIDDDYNLNNNWKYLPPVLRRQYCHQKAKSLPEAVQNRIVVLKNMQLEHLKLVSEHMKEIYELERKFNQVYQPLYDKRADIISGIVEPPQQQQPQYKKNGEEEDDFPELPDNDKAVPDNVKDVPDNVKGVPAFWLTVFKNVKYLAGMVLPHDEDALMNLCNVKVVYENDYSFIIEFYFTANKYFNNEKLTKRYFLRSEIEKFGNPFAYYDLKFFKVEGCKIDWKPDMDLTVKVNIKDQKKVPDESFFNFFNPPTPDEANESDEMNGKLVNDFVIGHNIRTQIIPKAVLYYTGDLIDDDESEYTDVEDTDDSDGEPPLKRNCTRKTL